MSQLVNKKTRGFTLIELMLAMGFVSFLLLAIAMTIIQMANIYNRGMTLKEVNQVARDISDDMRRTVAGSTVFTVHQNGTDSDAFVTLRHSSGKVIGGRICTGTTSYIWNSSYAIERQSEIIDVAKLSGPGSGGEAVRLFKVSDADRLYCRKNPNGTISQRDIRPADVTTGTELLETGDRLLGLQDLRILSSDASYDAGIAQRTYMVQYRIGTGETQAMNDTQTACLAPGEPNANWNYCNVQQFDILVRAGNTVGQE